MLAKIQLNFDEGGLSRAPSAGEGGELAKSLVRGGDSGQLTIWLALVRRRAREPWVGISILGELDGVPVEEIWDVGDRAISLDIVLEP